MFFDAVIKFEHKWQEHGKNWKDISDYMNNKNCNKNQTSIEQFGYGLAKKRSPNPEL